MTPAVLYLRISKDSDSSGSIENQRTSLQQYATRAGWTIVDEFVDLDRSGADESREGLWAAVAAVPRGGVLAVASLDRLARDNMILAVVRHKLKSRSATIVSLREPMPSNDALAEMITTILGAVAAYERALIAARTKSAHRRRIEAGLAVTRSDRPPYGWVTDDDGRLRRSENEQETISAMLELKRKGLSLRKICRALDARRLRPRCGRTWQPSTVRAILSRSDRKVTKDEIRDDVRCADEEVS